MTIRESRKWCEDHGLDREVLEEYRDYLEETAQESAGHKPLKLTWWDK